MTQTADLSSDVSADAARLLGTWSISPANDAETREQFGASSFEFQPEGKLVYRIDEGDREHRMPMTWRLEGSAIVTDDPDDPREERTGYRFVDADTLLLEYEGDNVLYIRTPVS
jgi:hypothetical protein